MLRVQTYREPRTSTTNSSTGKYQQSSSQEKQCRNVETLIWICYCWTEAVSSFVSSHSAVKVDFFSISYRQLEKQVSHWKWHESPCEQVLQSLSESRCQLWHKHLNTSTFFHPPGSRWCKCSNGAGLWDSGAGELQTDSDNGRDHLWALHVLEDPQRLSGVSSSQVGSQFDSHDNSHSSVKGSDSWLFVWNDSEESTTFSSALNLLKTGLVFFSNRDAKMLALTGFHNWFKSSIHKWLQIVHDRSCDRIRKAVETDKVRGYYNKDVQ